MDQELNSRFNDLLQKYIREDLTAEELTSFLKLARQPACQEQIRLTIGEQFLSDNWIDLTEGLNADEQFRKVLEKAKEDKLAEDMDNGRQTAKIRPLYYRYWWAAASLLLLLTGSIYFLVSRHRVQAPLTLHQPGTIDPGREGAVLQLADGSRLVLDSMGNGIVATQNGTQVRLKNGGLSYENPGSTAGIAAMNTMTTPRGRRFQLTLPDGTRVWLNAASSIRYPTVFRGKERAVQLNGEAYFEVAANATQPFRVAAGNANIEVLGTSFNINAYPEEQQITTTLLEGKVRVQDEASRSNHPQEKVLQPGQQAILPVNDPAEALTVRSADIGKVMAWKNGQFNFEGLSMREAMHQIERWYDITVVYEKGIPDIKFFGEISRDVTLNDLIQVLKDIGVHFRLDDGRKLVVMP